MLCVQGLRKKSWVGLYEMAAGLLRKTRAWVIEENTSECCKIELYVHYIENNVFMG